MLEKIKKYDTILMICFIICLVSGYALCLDIVAGDEIWNFNNVYKFSRGLILYQDINAIITPLFIWIGNLFFTILGGNLLSFRLYNIVLSTVFFTEIYLIIKRLIARKTVACMVFLFIVLIGRRLVLASANYNMLAIIFFLLGVLLISKSKKYDWKFSCIQGIILFAIFMSKQNIAVFYAVALFLFDIWLIPNKKESILAFVVQMFTFGLGIIAFFSYLYVSGLLDGFLSYAVWGLQEFGRENLNYEFSSMIYAAAIITVTGVMTIICLCYKKLKIEERVKKNIRILTCFCFPMCLIAFPIMNEYHITLGLTLCYILLIYIFYEMILKEFVKTGKLLQIIALGVMLFLTISSLFFFIQWLIQIQSSEYPFNSQSPFYGGIPDKIIAELDEMIPYIENNGKEVIIFSQDAAIYSMYFKTSHEAMDLPFLGNMGKNGEQEMLERIKKLNGKIILIRKEAHYQESEKIRQYIKENLKNVGEINQYLIYETTE